MACLMISIDIRDKCSKILVTSGKHFHVSHADYFPLPTNDETVSQPVRAWNMGRHAHVLGFILVTMNSYVAKICPVPNATQQALSC